LGAEIIEHEQGGIADLFKALFEGCILAVVGKTERIEQVGDGEKKGGDTHTDGIVGNGSGEVGLAAAVPALQKQPTFQAGSIMVGLVISPFKGIGLELANALLPAGLKSLEGEAAQLIQVAERIKALTDGLGNLDVAAGAYIELAKIRGTRLSDATDVADPMAVGAVGIAEGGSGGTSA